jgi:hypothetical protein
MIWITATKRVEADGLIAEIDLTANQTMRPQWIDLKGVAKQTDRAGFRGATYEDHHSLGEPGDWAAKERERGGAWARHQYGPQRAGVGTDLAARLCLQVGQEL